ncbi:MAG: hypothetical protein WDW38_001462 [Sanguina aurantia]
MAEQADTDLLDHSWDDFMDPQDHHLQELDPPHLQSSTSLHQFQHDRSDPHPCRTHQLHSSMPGPSDLDPDFLGPYLPPVCGPAGAAPMWQSAGQMHHPIQFNTLPTAHVVGLLPGVVCPANYTGPTHPNGLLGSHLILNSPQMLGGSLTESDAPSRLGTGMGLFAPAAPPYMHSTAGISHQQRLDGCAGAFGTPAAPQPHLQPPPPAFRPPVSTGMAFAHRSMSVGAIVGEEPASGRSVRASSVPFVTVSHQPERSALYSLWDAAQASLPELLEYSDNQVPAFGQTAAPFSTAAASHHPHHLPARQPQHHDPTPTHSVSLHAWSRPLTAAPVPVPGTIVQLVTQSTAGPSRHAAAHHPPTSSRLPSQQELLPGVSLNTHTLHLPPTSLPESDQDLLLRIHAGFASDTSSDEYRQRHRGNDGNDVSFLMQPAFTFPGGAVPSHEGARPQRPQPLPPLDQQLQQHLCRQEPGGEWTAPALPPEFPSFYPMVKQEVVSHIISPNSDKSSAFPVEWLLQSTTPVSATPTAHKLTPGMHRLTAGPCQTLSPPQDPRLPFGRHPTQSHPPVVARSSFNHAGTGPVGVPVQVQGRAGCFGGPPADWAAPEQPSEQLAGSPSPVCQLREMSENTCRGGPVRVTVCDFKKRAQSQPVERWPERKLREWQVLKEDVKQDPLLTNDRRQARGKTGQAKKTKKKAARRNADYDSADDDSC